MKKQILIIVVLTLTLGVGVTTSLTFVDAESALDLKCSELVGCSGSAFCEFGAPTGCTIDCSDSNVVFCSAE